MITMKIWTYKSLLQGVFSYFRWKNRLRKEKKNEYPKRSLYSWSKTGYLLENLNDKAFEIKEPSEIGKTHHNTKREDA